MLATDKTLVDDDLISFIISGPDAEYNPMIENVVGCSDPITLIDFYCQLLVAEARIDSQESYPLQMHLVARGRNNGGRSSRSGRGRRSDRHSDGDH